MNEPGQRGHRPPHQIAIDRRYRNDGDGREGENRAPVAQLPTPTHRFLFCLYFFCFGWFVCVCLGFPFMIKLPAGSAIVLRDLPTVDVE